MYPDSVDSCYSGNGRLHGIKGWCPKTSSDKTDYLQLDTGSVHYVCAVATQGFKGGTWRTTSYKVHLSTDGVTWNSYKENNIEKVNKFIYSHPVVKVSRDILAQNTCAIVLLVFFLPLNMQLSSCN